MSDIVTLTEDQQKASDAFFGFLMGDAKTFVLSGGAGVGKTFLMGHICKSVMQDYETACALLGIDKQYDTLAFTATTNKAAEVLEDSLSVPVSTIHSYMGLKVQEDWKTGKTRITKTSLYQVRRKYIVFIDESSMLDEEMYSLILKTFLDSKIVFVGDHAQMAPVNEDLSPVYENVDPDNFVFLSQPVRNAGNPALVNICKQLRHTVETGEFRPIEEVPGSIEYLDNDQMQAKLIKTFKDDLDPSSRILCYTNSRAQDFNSYIREIRGKGARIQAGDHLVCASSGYQTRCRNKVVLHSEREVVVHEVTSEVINAGMEDVSPDGLPVLGRVIQGTISSYPGVPLSMAVPADPWQWRETIKTLAKAKDWPRYFQLKGDFVDLRDKAACTVYKSQGSTYDHVFVDLGNIGTSYDPKQVARMLFVALSRAKSKVYLFGNLPGKYTRSSATCSSQPKQLMKQSTT